MVRKSTADNASQAAEQLNLKLPAARHEVLKAAAFVHGASNLRELVMPVLDRFIDDLASDEDVQLAMRARTQARARSDGKLSSLPPREASADDA